MSAIYFPTGEHVDNTALLSSLAQQKVIAAAGLHKQIKVTHHIHNQNETIQNQHINIHLALFKQELI